MRSLTLTLYFATCLLIGGCAQHSDDTSTVVQARQVPERLDDFAFENDKVAFRFYGPALKDAAENNGADCWLKRVDYPIIDKWYREHSEGKSYHEDTGEGYDPYHVGASLGCGGVALWQSNAEDKLHQPNVYQRVDIIEKTPEKVVFELEYHWQEADVREIKRITLQKGDQLYKAESRFTKSGVPAILDVAVGVTTHNGKADVSANDYQNIVSTWENIDGSGLGTAVILPYDNAVQFVHLQSDETDRSHGVVVTTTDSDGRLTYYAGFAWQKAGDITSHSEWQDYTKSFLKEKTGQEPLTSHSVKSLTKKVADWQIAHHEEQGKYRAIPRNPPDWANRNRYHDLEWHHGALYAGMDQWREIADDPKYTEWLRQIGERNEWELHQRPYHADDHTVGQFYLSFYEQYQQPRMMSPTKARFDWILDNPKNGTLDWLAEDTHAHDRWGWCDALFMAPPVWARLAKITGEEKYLEFMDKEYHVTYDLLWSEKDHLFWRDSSYFTQSEKNGEDIFWARGNGWVFGGLALMIPDLPKNWEGRPFYIDLFKKMANRLQSIQREDGTWSMGLLGGTEGYPEIETSGTSFFTFGLAWGINQGILDRDTFRPTIMKAWRALQDAVNDEGMLGYVQPVGAAPGDSFKDFTEVYGTGAFLAAGTELYKMLKEEEVTKTLHLAEMKTFMDDSGWCWFQDPRAIIQNDKLIIGGVSGHDEGEAAAGVYNLASDQLIGRAILHPDFDHDDHNSPVFYPRPDGSLLTVYARHSTENKHYYRISDPHNYLQWSPEKIIEQPDPVTYMNLYPLEEEGRLYNFFRGIKWNPTLVTSDDHGETWSEATHFIQNEVEGVQRPYARYTGDGKDTIGISFTDAHPRDFGNSIYYAEFRHGNFYRADGTLIKNLKEDGALKPSEAEKVFQGGEGTFRGLDLSAENSAWTSAITFDSQGFPHIAYTLYLTNDDQRYRLASWDGTSWHDREIAYAGGRLYDREASYTGLITLDPKNPKHVVISTDVDPSSGVPLKGKHQVFRATVEQHDTSETIVWQRLSASDDQHNIRPMVVRGKDNSAIVWLQGQYNSYTDYDMDAVGLIF